MDKAQGLVRLEGLSRMKNPVTLSGIEPATFRLAAQCLKQLRCPIAALILHGSLVAGLLSVINRRMC
jgi:hypothetical protein